MNKTIPRENWEIHHYYDEKEWEVIGYEDFRFGIPRSVVIQRIPSAERSEGKAG